MKNQRMNKKSKNIWVCDDTFDNLLNATEKIKEITKIDDALFVLIMLNDLFNW